MCIHLLSKSYSILINLAAFGNSFLYYAAADFQFLLFFKFNACILIKVLLLWNGCIYSKNYVVKGGQKMAKCQYCGKGVSFGIKVSHSHRRSNRMWKPNVKRVKAVVGGASRRVHVCTRCLRSGKVARAV
jgi:ribosomal protein L28